MGGGDLNLKKSWHPNTMKNMERVWKAEQKDTEEKKRIAELQREINAERNKEDMQKFAEDTGVVKKKDDIKLEWMYKGPSQSVNHEDYLLGKAVDKNFERYSNQQKGGPSTSQDEERVPDAMRQARSSVFSEQVDVARKMNEDPLMAIRQRAVEKAKQLYNNPVRMKQIKKMISEKSAEEKAHKKDKKKKKKSKKSSNIKEDKMLDGLLMEKLKSALKDRKLLRKLKKKAHGGSDESSSSSSESSCSNESDEDHKNQRPKKILGDIEHHKRSHSPEDLKDDRRKSYPSSSYDRKDTRRQSRSPRPSKSRNFDDHVSSSRRRASRSRSRDRDLYNHLSSSRKPSRSRSQERQKYHSKREQPTEGYKGTSGRSSMRSNSPHTSSSKKPEYFPKKRQTYKDNSPSSNDESSRKNNDRGKKNRRDHSDSDSTADSDDDVSSRKKRTFGLMMADGSRPVPTHNPVTKEVKPLPQPQKPTPTPWQRKEKVKLSEEEKDRKRQEMLQNASWRDKERVENVKRYRQEDAHERKQLHQNFDEDFARKQFSKAAEQTSVEGRIKSKLNTIQRSKMSMDQHFARR